MKDVAAEVGVSPATVSNAYNRPEQLSGALRVKIMEAARRLGYAGPDPTARGLRRGRVGAIGVLYADRLSYAFADPAAVPGSPADRGVGVPWAAGPRLSGRAATVGTAGFEPATPGPPDQCAARLRHVPCAPYRIGSVTRLGAATLPA